VSANAKAVALVRWGRPICPGCARSSEEVAILTDPDASTMLMRELKIDVLTGDQLKGGEKCGVCGARIEAKP